MLWKFNPNQERSAFFDAVWKQYAQFANNQHFIADASKMAAFCDTLRAATLTLIFTAEKAENAGNILSKDETASILKTINFMSNFYNQYSGAENIANPSKLKDDLSALGEQMAEGTILGWEYKLSGKFPQDAPKIVPEKNHAKNGSRRPAH